MNIGWIGLGTMGVPMATQLLKAGYQLTVYNRSEGKASALEASGATVSASPQSLIEKTDVVIVMVTDDQAIRAVFDGENGLLNASASGKTIINMSTVSPAISKEMSDKCKAIGSEYLDAPVSGSVKQAETSQLAIMVGGDQTVFDRVKPILEAMGKMAILVGAVGAGNYAKLAINSLLALYTQGLAETILFANQNGVRTEDLLNLINNAAISNVFTKIKGDAILNDNFQPAFTLKNIVKDLRLAKDDGLESPLAKTALASFEEAEERYGNEDLIAIIKALK
ncbi:NAD(P)-dependent oxidoreductase [Pedobacter frigidisoli]|uniref:NAD(P)-dependent oxidoreductase n=1 Tax=Pedobacter frigidisoli TaxID=2530455 RepID=UPI00293026FF|nr:NAD(P)-dependent oxidoreductase [Pedobacter frigidisoli]